MKRDSSTYALIAVLTMTALFVIGRFAGGYLFDNHWSFIHWHFLDSWYLALWSITLIGLGGLLWKRPELLTFPNLSKRVVLVAAGLLIAVVVLFRFDSFVFGGSNLLVADIAQSEVTVHRWFQAGTSLIVNGLFAILSPFVSKANDAGVAAWTMLSFACTLATMLASVQLAGLLAQEKARRVSLFILLFFGPQMILMFGFPGIEPVVVAFSSWFALIAVRLIQRFTVRRLIALWVLVLAGLIMHYTLIYLLPAAIFVTISTIRSSRTHRTTSLFEGLIGLVAIVVLAYVRASSDLEFSTFLLFLTGKNPHPDYGIFSPRHLGDIGQLLFLAMPHLFALPLFWNSPRRDQFLGRLTALAAVMTLSGLTVLMMLDPRNSIPFDYPRLVAYLYPISLLAAVVIARLPEGRSATRLVSLLALVSIMIPISYLPAYTNIERADGHLADYLEQHNDLYQEGCFAFRDAYFHNGSLDQANAWEWKVPTYSLEYKGLQGCYDLAARDDEAEAIRILNHMIAEDPYWTEPRSLLASLQMKLNRFELAKPHIDTCLMLEPYRKNFHIHLYSYYRESGRFNQAIESIRGAMDLFPYDNSIAADLGFVYYRMRAFDRADSIATKLLAEFPDEPLSHSLKATVDEFHGKLRSAILHYRRFIELAPDDPDVPAARKQINLLRQRLPDNQ